MRTRRAISMIELLMIMSACSVALSLMGVLLHRVMLVQMHSRAHVDAERTALRLAAQFRRDVHRSRDAAVGDAEGDNAALLRLQLADGRTVEYSRDGASLLRVESGSDRPTWREEFRFMAVNEVTIEEVSAPPQIVLTLAAKPLELLFDKDKPPVSTHLVPVSVRVEAVIGQDLRLETRFENREASE